ncbi:MAG TPA: hypothetical protein VHO50_00770 [Bacteroidales bacterium]|nr:hypothetical protein [Bacteroidales bacterium]
MKRFAVFLIFITFETVSYCQIPANQKSISISSLWSKINETTWFQDNGFAGQSYVFYEDHLGKKRCIYQLHGSGLYVVIRDCTDFEIIDSLRIRINNAEFTLQESYLVSDSGTMRLYSKTPLVYNRTGLIDIDLVKSNDFKVRDID